MHFPQTLIIKGRTIYEKRESEKMCVSVCVCDTDREKVGGREKMYKCV